MKIKICGITRVEDALVCIENNVDFLGFNFYPPSPRSLYVDRAVEIMTELKAYRERVKMIGVFVNANTLEIERIVRTCGLDAAQLHGKESPAEISELREKGIPAFKAFRGTPEKIDFKAYLPSAQDLSLPDALIDAYHPGLFGGTGELLESEQIKAVDHLRNLHPQRRIMLAGGLKPENVAQMITVARPWGVDTASGVEFSPGIKDRQKIIEFCRAARA